MRNNTENMRKPSCKLGMSPRKTHTAVSQKGCLTFKKEIMLSSMGNFYRCRESKEEKIKSNKKQYLWDTIKKIDGMFPFLFTLQRVQEQVTVTKWNKKVQIQRGIPINIWRVFLLHLPECEEEKKKEKRKPYFCQRGKIIFELVLNYIPFQDHILAHASVNIILTCSFQERWICTCIHIPES